MVPEYTYIITDTGIPVILVIGGIPVDRAQRSRAEIALRDRGQRSVNGVPEIRYR